MKLSAFSGTGSAVTPLDVSWEEFVRDLFPHRAIENKETAPSFSFTEFQPGTPRRNENAIAMHGVCLDFDHLTYEQIPALVAKAKAQRCALYTTHRHGLNGEIRLRLVIPFIDPAPSKDHVRIYESWGYHFGATWDDSCKRPASLFFVPTHPPTPYAPPSYEIFDGPIVRAKTHLVNNPTRDMIKALAVGLSRSKDPERRQLAASIKAVVKGEPYAEEGSRNNTAVLIVRALQDVFPDADPNKIAEFFAASHGLMGPGTDDIAAMWSRLLHVEANRAPVKSLREKHIAWVRNSDNTDYYTKDEWANFSSRGANPPILRWRGQYFFLGPKGYFPPIDSQGAEIAWRQFLAPIEHISFEHEGKTTPFNKVFHEFGRTVAHHAYSYVLQSSTYNPATDTLIQPCAPRRPVVAAYSADVDRWLRLAFRGSEFEAVCRWFTFLTDLDQPLAALFVTGAPHTGKSLLAFAVGRIWHLAGPVRLDTVLAQQFTEDLKRNPFVHADEGIPDDPKGRNATEYLRDFVARSIQPLNEKNIPRTYIEGHIRLIVTANSTASFRLPHNQTEDDVNAIAERFIHVEMDPEAAAYLKDRNDETNDWVNNDTITGHILWIRDKMLEIGTKREGRFAIPTTLGKPIASHIFYASGMQGRILEWVVKFLRKPRPLQFQPIRKGHFYITALQLLSVVQAEYQSFGNPRDMATEIQAARALQGIADKIDGGYYRIKIDAIKTIAKLLGDTPEEIDKALANRMGEN